MPGGGRAAGTDLWQFTPNGTDAQSFRFEDAGGGFVNIRTLAGLYVTADAPSGVLTGGGATLKVKQDLKYPPGSKGAQDPNLQRWRFASSPVSAVNPTNHTISCAAIPGKVLQPLNGGATSGTSVVLADPTTHPPSGLPNPWGVTSPLLPSGGVLHA